MADATSLILGGPLLFIGWQVVRALWSGEWSVGKWRYRRDEEPAEYWFSVVHAAAAGAMIAWLVAAPGDRLFDKVPWRFFVLVLFGLPAAFWLVRSLQTETTGFADIRVDRLDQPGKFWLLILGHVAFIAFAFWTFATWQGPPPPDFYDEVRPVLAAIRREWPPSGEAAAFRNVRVDQASGAVCGEVGPALGAGRRFFGAPTGEGVDVTLENESAPDFEDGYRRACSGRRILQDGPAPPARG